MDTDSHSRTTESPAGNPAVDSDSESTGSNDRHGRPPFALVKAFSGPEGLYAGGRWLVYLCIGLMTLIALNFVVEILRLRPANVLWRNMVFEIKLMVAAFVPGLVMARLEGRAFGDFGLPAKIAFGKDFWAGAIWGICGLTVLVGMMRILGVFSFGTLRLHGIRALKLGLFYAVFFLITAFFEDFLMRGYSQWVLTRCMNYWPAAVLLSVIFGAVHSMNPGESRIGLVAVVGIGLFFCLTLRRTGTLWWAVGFHMAWDWGETYFYSVPDSGGVLPGHLLNSSFYGPAWLTGGSVGPEGSYLVFVVIAALWWLFSRVYPEVKYGAQVQS